MKWLNRSTATLNSMSQLQIYIYIYIYIDDITRLIKKKKKMKAPHTGYEYHRKKKAILLFCYFNKLMILTIREGNLNFGSLHKVNQII